MVSGGNRLDDETDVRGVRGYILVTPAKNEEEFLPRTIRSVLAQSRRPVLWVIVDDNSDDGTHAIIEEFRKEYPFIVGMQPDEKAGNYSMRYSHVCREGFGYAREYARENGIDYGYIGLLDSDVVLSREYFEGLMGEMEGDGSLGITSGEYYVIRDGGVHHVPKKDMTYIGGGIGRLWKKECFEETGGYLLTMAPDSVSNVKAKLRGWKLRRFPGQWSVQLRSINLKGKLTSRSYINGEKCFYLNHHPLLVFLKFSGKLVREGPTAFGFLYGYFNGYFKGKSRIEDAEIREYFFRTKPMEIFRLHMVKRKGERIDGR